jgi:tRNA G10  N-methylase Trm11
LGSREAILILAFGKLSLLEFCSLLSNRLVRAELLCERAALATIDRPLDELVTTLGGIHKYASPMTLLKDIQGSEVRQFLENVLQHKNEIHNLSVSEYCEESGGAFSYEDLVHTILGSLRDLGFRKIRLLRPEGNELVAEQVVLRDSLDFVAVHTKKGEYFGVTSYVPDVESYRERGTGKPIRIPSISMSPRLARTLVNLAGLSPGQTLLDPFCGSGTILAEALLHSLNCLGVDNNPNRVHQADQNLKWVQENTPSKKLGTYHVLYGDSRDLSRYLDGVKFDAIVTEPILLPNLTARPSMKSAHEMVNKASKVYSDALYAMSQVVKSGGRVVMVVPVLQTTSDLEVSIRIGDVSSVGLHEYHHPHMRFEYPVRLSFESTRWVRRAVYVFVRN